MNDILAPVALVLVYGLGYYIIFLGAPALVKKAFPRATAKLVIHAERKFPREQGLDAVQFLIATRLGIAGCIGTAVLIAAGLLSK